MRHQRLQSVVVEGFTSIRSAELALNDVNVLVGANGAGKSNLIRALGMLGRHEAAFHVKRHRTTSPGELPG